MLIEKQFQVPSKARIISKAVINQGLVGGCYLWGLWSAPPLRFTMFTFGIEVSLRQIGGGREWGSRKNRSTLNLKPLELLVFIKSTNQIGHGAFAMIPSHQFKKPQHSH